MKSPNILDSPYSKLIDMTEPAKFDMYYAVIIDS